MSLIYSIVIQHTKSNCFVFLPGGNCPQWRRNEPFNDGRYNELSWNSFFKRKKEEDPTDSRANTDPRKGILEPRRRVLLGNHSFPQDGEQGPAGLVLRRSESP